VADVDHHALAAAVLAVEVHEELLATRQPNVYTIEKQGVKKLICQVPWFRDGAYAGFLELSLEIPFQMPHFVRAG
jgi:hypothetical protein